MTNTDESLTNLKDVKIGQEMSYISFSTFVEELTGTKFEEFYKEQLKNGELYEQSNLG